MGVVGDLPKVTERYRPPTKRDWLLPLFVGPQITAAGFMITLLIDPPPGRWTELILIAMTILSVFAGVMSSVLLLVADFALDRYAGRSFPVGWRAWVSSIAAPVAFVVPPLLWKGGPEQSGATAVVVLVVSLAVSPLLLRLAAGRKRAT